VVSSSSLEGELLGSPWHLRHHPYVHCAQIWKDAMSTGSVKIKTSSSDINMFIKHMNDIIMNIYYQQNCKIAKKNVNSSRRPYFSM